MEHFSVNLTTLNCFLRARRHGRRCRPSTHKWDDLCYIWMQHSGTWDEWGKTRKDRKRERRRVGTCMANGAALGERVREDLSEEGVVKGDYRVTGRVMSSGTACEGTERCGREAWGTVRAGDGGVSPHGQGPGGAGSPDAGSRTWFHFKTLRTTTGYC